MVTVLPYEIPESYYVKPEAATLTGFKILSELMPEGQTVYSRG